MLWETEIQRQIKATQIIFNTQTTSDSEEVRRIQKTREAQICTMREENLKKS